MVSETFWVSNGSSAPIRSILRQLTTCISYDARDSKRDKQDEASVITLISLNHLTKICSIGDQLQMDARNWISPPDPSKNYNIASEIYQTGTGLWFFQGGVFSEWCSKGKLLWIHGKRASVSVVSINGS